MNNWEKELDKKILATLRPQHEVSLGEKLSSFGHAMSVIFLPWLH